MTKMQKLTQNEEKENNEHSTQTRHAKYSFTFTVCLVVCKQNIQNAVIDHSCDTNCFYIFFSLHKLFSSSSSAMNTSKCYAHISCSFVQLPNTNIESNDNKTTANLYANDTLCGYKIVNICHWHYILFLKYCTA